MNAVDNYLMQVLLATTLRPKQLANSLLRLLLLHPQNNRAVVNFNNVGNLEVSQISNAVDARKFYNDDWLAFNQVVVSFIHLANQINPWSALESFDLYSTYINDLLVAFTNKNHGFLLSPLIESSIEFIIPLATQLDFQLAPKEMNRNPRLTYLASILLKIFNNIRSQLGAGDNAEVAKRSILLFIGTKLCLTYFKLANPLLCRNVFSNMNNASLRFNKFHKNQQIQYRYFLAKFYLVKYQFVDAYQHFMWCLQHCPRNYLQDNANVSRILRELIPVAMILGKTPNFASIYLTYYTSASKAPRFLAIYLKLMSIIRIGSFYQFHSFITQNFEMLKQQKSLLFISNKSGLVLLRNLLKRVWIMEGSTARLSYDSVSIALATSLQGIPLGSVSDFVDPASQTSGVQNEMLQNQRVDDQLVENCLVTLIDQNLLKGKLFPRLRMISLSKIGAFPAVDSIDFVKFGNGNEGTLNYSDKWME